MTAADDTTVTVTRDFMLRIQRYLIRAAETLEDLACRDYDTQRMAGILYSLEKEVVANCDPKSELRFRFAAISSALSSSLSSGPGEASSMRQAALPEPSQQGLVQTQLLLGYRFADKS